MHKTLLYVLATLMLVFSAVNVSGLDIIESSVSLSGNHSTTIQGTFTVHNNGASDIPLVALDKENLLGDDGINDIPASKVSFSPSSFAIAAGNVQEVNFTITIPSNQYAQGYEAEFSAYNVVQPSDNDTLDVDLAVEEDIDFSISSDSPAIIQGETGTLTVTLENTGNADIDTLIYEISSEFVNGGYLLSYAQASAGFVDVDYGTSENITLTFSVDASQATGMYSAEITTTKNSVEKTAPLSVNVQALNEDITLETLQNGKLAYDRTSGQVITASKQGFEFKVTNTGNVDLTGISITKSDLASGTDTISSANLAISSSSFNLNAGESEIVVVNSVGLDSANTTSGTYTGAFDISFGGKTKSISVRFDVRDAVYQVSFPDVTLPEGPRESVQSASVTITNTGDFGLTSVDISAYNTPSGAEVNISGVPASLAVGASATLDINAFIPKSQSSGVKRLANLEISSTEMTSNAELYSDVPSKLAITKARLTLNDERETLEDEETADKTIGPRQSFSLEVKVENLFDDNDDIDIEDILIEAIFIDVGEDGEDIEGESEEFDLEAEEDRELKIDFDEDTIASDIEEGVYAIEITVTGDDEDGAIHEDTWTIYVEVERENSVDLLFDTVELNPSTVSCSRTAYLTIEGANIGSKNNRDSRLIITSEKLGLNVEHEFKIGNYNDDDCDAISNPDDECSEIDHREVIEIPNSVAPGNYPIRVAWYYKTNQKGDEEIVTLKVESCDNVGYTPLVDDKDEEEYVEVDDAAVELDVQFSDETDSDFTEDSEKVYANPTLVTDTTKNKFLDSPLYLVLLGLVNFTVVMFIISLVVGKGKKRK